jgi:hypothetical protein
MSSIRVTDGGLKRLVELERSRRGDASLGKTLGDLARERLVDLEKKRERGEAVNELPPDTALVRRGLRVVGDDGRGMQVGGVVDVTG